jgi:hypothetical protein
MLLAFRERVRRQSVSHFAGSRLPGIVQAISVSLPKAAATSPATTEPANTAPTISKTPPADFNAMLPAHLVICLLKNEKSRA